MTPARIFCTQCGTPLPATARFCTQCGKPVGVAPPPLANVHIPRRFLHRVTRDKKIAGVCAGFAQYFEMDVTLMRIIFLALLVLPPGVGLIGYIIAWVAMPRDAGPQNANI